MTKNKTKKGAASIYAVVFATLLLGIVTVSFVRLILRESTDTTNNDLSRSSRDSALAGVEDAKRAIDALGGPDDRSVEPVTYDQCDFVSQVLYGQSGEVLIKETTTGSSKTEQAYTCVKVNPKTEDYRGQIDDTEPVAIIPLRHNASEGSIEYVTFSWQESNGQTLYYPNSSHYAAIGDQSKDGSNVPPVVSLQYIQLPSNATYDSVSYYDMTDSTPNTNTMYLTPKNNGSSITEIPNTNNYHDKDGGAYGLGGEKPVYVSCNQNGLKDGFVCSIALELPDSAADQNKYLVASLPYNNSTSFSVKMYRGDYTDETNRLDFQDVQYKIDSTGRANDLYTRLEVRLTTNNPAFPYPKFALQTEETLEKYFWVTRRQCVKIDNGEVAGDCSNSSAR